MQWIHLALIHLCFPSCPCKIKNQPVYKPTSKLNLPSMLLEKCRDIAQIKRWYCLILKHCGVAWFDRNILQDHPFQQYARLQSCYWRVSFEPKHTSSHSAQWHTCRGVGGNHTNEQIQRLFLSVKFYATTCSDNPDKYGRIFSDLRYLMRSTV